MSEPLAERMRPRSLAEYVGQKHLVGEGAVLRKMIDAGRMSSFILWGPPGVGKTTLAHVISTTLKVPFYTLSAVTSGVFCLSTRYTAFPKVSKTRYLEQWRKDRSR